MMKRSRKRRLDHTVALLRSRYGDEVVRRGSDLSQTTVPPHIPTGFVELDALTGCGGIPFGRTTILEGPSTSGKLTLAYKTLANFLQSSRSSHAAILDLVASSDPHYLERCGIRLERTMLVCPDSPRQSIDLLLDLVHNDQVGAILVDSLPHLVMNRRDARYLNGSLAALNRLVLASRCAVIFLDESQPPWLHWTGFSRSYELQQWVALRIELRREDWLYQDKRLVGYSATARILKSRWSDSNGTAPVSIRFDDTVGADRTW